MLTYLLQQRHIKMTGDTPPSLPNAAEVSCEMVPPQAFGAAEGDTRMTVKARKAKALWNANTGRYSIKSDPPLERLRAEIENEDGSAFSLDGNVMTLKFHCESMDHLIATIAALHYVYPAILSVYMQDAPFVCRVWGTLGELGFRWEHKKGHMVFAPTTSKKLEQQAINTFSDLELFSGSQNRRIAAALSYHQTAARLLDCGSSQWEFMGEVMLNWCKALEVLFGGTRDDIEEGLRDLGIHDDMIKRVFLPLIILRSHLDVAHPRLAIFPQDHLQDIYEYLSDLESWFRYLMRVVLDNVRSGKLELQQDDDLRLDADERATFERLVDTIRKRPSLTLTNPRRRESTGASA